jgi:outer membrane receptor protein involved in Fe transport
MGPGARGPGAKTARIIMKTSPIAMAAALSAAACLPAHPAMAEDAPDSTQIVVTAARGTALQDMDVSATVLNAQQIAAVPQIATDQLLNHIPGIFTLTQPVAQIHPTGDTFSIRGFGTTTNVNTLVMLDGVPMNDPYFRTVDWSQIPKGQLAGVEVIRGGGATSLWGNMAMGGIVNLLARTPQAGHLDLDVNAGSYRSFSGAVSAGVALAPNVTAGLNASRAVTDGYNQTPVQYRNPYMGATASTNTNLEGVIRATPSATSTLYVSYLWHSIQERGLVWTPTQNRWDTWRITFGGDTALGAASKLSFNGWYGGGSMDTTNVSQSPGYSLINPTAAIPYVSQTEHVTYANLGGSLVFQTSLGALHDVKLGVDGRSIAANDPLQFYGTAGATGTILAHAQHHFEGAFAQGTLAVPGVPLDVTLGLRGDFWQTSNGSITGSYLGSAFANGLAGQSYARFDPRLGAKLKLARALTLRGAVYSNFAAPGMNQMYRAFIGGVNYTTSNPGLKPQTNIGEEVGLDLRLGGLSLTANAYANRLKNFIDYATVQSGCAAANSYCGTGIVGISGGSLRQYVNAGDATLRGVEVLGDWALGPVSLTGGFTYTDAHLTRSLYTTPSAGVVPDPVGQQLGQVPEWTANAGVTWAVTDRIKLNVTTKSFPAYWNTTSHTQRNDGATLVDLGASWQVRRGLELYTSLQNIGNRHYYDQGLAVTTTNGTTVSNGTIPALGMPFWATFGLRAHI